MNIFLRIIGICFCKLYTYFCVLSMVIEFYNYLHNRTYLFIHRVTVRLILSRCKVYLFVRLLKVYLFTKIVCSWIPIKLQGKSSGPSSTKRKWCGRNKSKDLLIFFRGGWWGRGCTGNWHCSSLPPKIVWLIRDCLHFHFTYSYMQS